MYDYAELAVSQSDLSTPGSSTGQDPPFAAEGLGDTVINLDEVRLLTCCIHSSLIRNLG